MVTYCNLTDKYMPIMVRYMCQKWEVTGGGGICNYNGVCAHQRQNLNLVDERQGEKPV